MSLKLGTVNIAGLNTNAHSLFDFKWSDHLQDDMSWLRADTFSWQDGTVYSNAYNKLVSEYNNGTAETVGGITFKRTTNGFKIADASQESAILSKYNTDGIAWFYILDTTNTRFKLPRTKFGFEGLRTNVGDDIAESLPNITGTIDQVAFTNGDRTATGSITKSNEGAWTRGYSSPNNTFYANKVGIDASLSSSTYQDNAPVQERATQMYLYFYVGEFSQTAIEQTAGITSEQLSAKLDIPTRYVVAKSDKAIFPSWWVEYSDGWCEQGGQAQDGSTVTFLKPFSDTNYNVLLTTMVGSGEVRASSVNTHLKTTTSFIPYFSGSVYWGYWRASGYIN